MHFVILNTKSNHKEICKCKKIISMSFKNEHNELESYFSLFWNKLSTHNKFKPEAAKCISTQVFP